MDWYNIVNLPEFQRTFGLLIVSSTFFAVAITLAAFAFYGRARDMSDHSPEAQRWTLLMGTWRDSLIITLLYTSESMLFRANEFQASVQLPPSTILLYMPVMQPIGGFVLSILIFVVAALRIILITRWLAAQNVSSQE